MKIIQSQHSKSYECWNIEWKLLRCEINSLTFCVCRCLDCRTPEHVHRHATELREEIWLSWDVEWARLGLVLHHLNTKAAPQIGPHIRFNHAAVGIPQPRRCGSCDRTSYFHNRADYDDRRFTEVGGWGKNQIPWEEIQGAPCISCLKEYITFIHK